jgi:hypothetical protein
MGQGNTHDEALGFVAAVLGGLAPVFGFFAVSAFTATGFLPNRV